MTHERLEQQQGAGRRLVPGHVHPGGDPPELHPGLGRRGRGSGAHWPKGSFIHHLGYRFVVGVDFEEVASAHARLAESKAAGRSFGIRKRGRTRVAWGTRRHAQLVLGLDAVGRVQISSRPGGGVYLIARAAIDPVVVARRFLDAIGVTVPLQFHNLAYLELAVATRTPRASRPARRASVPIKRKLNDPIEHLHAEYGRAVTPTGSRIDALVRVYRRTGDPNHGTLKCEASTARVARDGHIVDSYLRPDSRLSIVQVISLLGRKLARTLDKLHLESLPMPLSYRGLPLISGDMNAGNTASASWASPSSDAPRTLRSHQRPVVGPSELVSLDGVVVFATDEDRTLVDRFSAFTPFQEQRYRRTNPIITLVGDEDSVAEPRDIHSTAHAKREESQP